MRRKRSALWPDYHPFRLWRNEFAEPPHPGNMRYPIVMFLFTRDWGFVISRRVFAEIFRDVYYRNLFPFSALTSHQSFPL